MLEVKIACNNLKNNLDISNFTAQLFLLFTSYFSHFTYI
jgi:hypothetical protein